MHLVRSTFNGCGPIGCADDASGHLTGTSAGPQWVGCPRYYPMGQGHTLCSDTPAFVCASLKLAPSTAGSGTNSGVPKDCFS